MRRPRDRVAKASQADACHCMRAWAVSGGRMTPRRGRPPKPPDEVRTVRVTVLLTEREHATLLRACGGRGVASLLVRGGLAQAGAEDRAPSTIRQLTTMLVEVRRSYEAERAMALAHIEELAMRREVDGERDVLRALADDLRKRVHFKHALPEALTVTSGLRVGKSEASRKAVAKAKAAGVPAKVKR